MCYIQRVLNACRVFGFQNSFEFNLFGFAHDADFRSKLIELLDIAHAAKHLRGDLRNYRFKIVVHAIANVCFIKSCGIICEYVACHWKVKPYSPIYWIALDMLRRTRYKQTDGKIGGFGFLVRQSHAVIHLRPFIMHGGDIVISGKYAFIVFLLHSADLLRVQKRNRAFGNVIEVGKQTVFDSKSAECLRTGDAGCNRNGVQSVGAVDEVFDADESIIVHSSENLIGHGVKYGYLLIGKGYKSFGKEVQFIQAESVQADVLQLRQDIAFEDAHFNRVFSADGTSLLHSVLDFIVRRRQQ